MKIKVSLYSSLDQSSRSFELQGNRFLIGRGNACHIILDDMSVSKIHAMLTINAGIMTITDLYSLNGVWLGENKITENLISSDDTIQIGHTEIQFELIESDLQNSDKTQEIDLIGLGFDTETVEPSFSYRLASTLSGIHPLEDENLCFDLEKSDDVGSIINTKISLGRSIEATIMVADTIKSVRYLSIEEAQFFFNSEKETANRLLVHGLKEKNQLFMLKMTDGFQLKPIPEARLLDLSGNKDFQDDVILKEKDCYVYDFGVIKVYLRFSSQAPTLLPQSFFENDKNLTKAMSGALVIVLLLVMIAPWMRVVEEKVEERVVAVIYKPTPITPVQQNEGSSGAAPKTAETKTVQKKASGKTFQSSNLLKSFNKLLATSNSVSEVSASSGSSSAQEVAVSNTGAVGRNPSSLGGGSVNGSGLAGGNGQKDIGTGLGGGGTKRGMMVGEVATRTVILGSIDPDLLRKILQEYLPQFRHCYQKELDKNSNKIKGVIDLEFTIGKAGLVVKTNVKAKDSGFSNDGIGCLSSVLRVIKFPEPKGGGVVDVRQPLNFYSEDSKS